MVTLAMRKALIFLGAALLLVAGCTRFKKEADREFKKANGDLWYKMLDDQEGEAIKEDDFIGLTYTESTAEGAVLYSSADEDGRIAQMFRERSHFPGDLFAAFGLLSEGDSASFKVNLDSIVAYQQRRRPDTKGRYLLYTVKVNKVVARGGLNDSLYNAAISDYREDQTALAKGGESTKFKNYLSAKKLKPLVTASGLHYTINQKGNGLKAAWGDTVLVNYTAMYLSEKVIETSSAEVAKKARIYHDRRQYGPVKLVMNKNSVISGFDEALMMFPEGTKYTLIIPSRLAYGADGTNIIKPYTPLLCEAVLLDVIPRK
jgi:FKBP-type peptidyl-prolyl cis-trans isomerase FkpA